MTLKKQTSNARKNWEFQPNQKLIKRKKRNLFIRLTQYIFPFFNTYRVQAIYRLSKEEWSSSPELQKFSFPFDSMPIRGTFKLNNNWKILDKDINRLKDGPLFAEDGIRIIVPSQTTFEIAKQWANLLRPALIPIVIGLLYKIIGLLDWVG